MSYFHMAAATLSSALSVFTSEFGMDSGGTHLLLSPGKLVTLLCVVSYNTHALYNLVNNVLMLPQYSPKLKY